MAVSIVYGCDGGASLARFLFSLINLQVVGQLKPGLGRRLKITQLSTQRRPRRAASSIDRNGYVLARNVASYNVVITPADLPDDDADIQRIYREICHC
ncbi:MAG: hypothetical protein MZV70_21235 [Desulfobacterales bacterium]|nr:hypothetical protein [Desulfobacterales bacterium]